MPVYPLSTEWSEPIQLEARDIVQNQGGYAVEITASDPEVDPARLLLPPYSGALQVEGATSIRARIGVGGGTLHVVRGF